MANIVFIATSLDGYIADKNNEIEWLHSIPGTQELDLGYDDHIAAIDGLVMGRNTFELVCGFDCDWPYTKPVFVLSNTMRCVPTGYEDKVKLVSGGLLQLVDKLNAQGFVDLYIDGGVTIQSFLKSDLIDKMIITTIPIILGGGVSLFGELAEPLHFSCTESELFENGICQNTFVRKR
ncbi:dihydrofolate reductase family protein [Pseudoalteromonas luteoviolacea]|uniref:dihydrofolate reductase family protein n=1 Tax=Pseudoalteromonas luteoviolacea TaxID=43657 RepID=UPI001F3AAE90|nr:dihydrofolate reductase family protein [Pseudoalteromonas luteoviolacea]MCF6440595.1 dihydrofolate reductase family protein [Pseudoalteromonas luteoviolacea]